jgi:hypothetical protein
VGKGNAGLGVKQRTIPGITKPPRQCRKPVNLIVAGRVEEGRADDQRAAFARSAGIGPGGVGFYAEHPRPCLVIVTDLAAAEDARDAGRRGNPGTRDIHMVIVQNTATQGASIEAGPV